MGFSKSWFSDSYHANPTVNYVKKGSISFSNREDFLPLDEFVYTKIKISKTDVKLSNSILLDVSYKYISYKSESCFYKTIKYYNKIKNDKFINKKDYSHLLKKLFKELNRTHFNV
jgi:hypothetical protein